MPTGDDTPKKKIRKTKTARAKKTISSGLSGVVPDSNLEKETFQPVPAVENLIKEAFTRFYDDKSIEKQKMKDLQHLDSVVDEFLKAYIIIGYDLSGEKVHIFHAENAMEKDSLIEHMRTTLMTFLNKENN